MSIIQNKMLQHFQMYESCFLILTLGQYMWHAFTLSVNSSGATHTVTTTLMHFSEWLAHNGSSQSSVQSMTGNNRLHSQHDADITEIQLGVHLAHFGCLCKGHTGCGVCCFLSQTMPTSIWMLTIAQDQLLSQFCGVTGLPIVSNKTNFYANCPENNI